MQIETLKKLLEKQGYRVVGYGAVKLCTWLKKSLHNKGFCYKQKFYGIESHRCLQCTPCAFYCTQRCVFCWRVTSWIGSEMKEYDDPAKLVDGFIEAQHILLSGFKGDPTADQRKVAEAMEPRHAAISLIGEPMLYPRMSELLDEFHARGFTTFIVTNGTLPQALEKLETLPTQLYVTVAAPTREIYEKTCRPLLKDGWERLNETLELLPSLETRKVIRLTLVKDLNMVNPEAYAKLIEKADPHFVEFKAFMSVGQARDRLPYESMPRHNEIMEFAKQVAEILGWQVIDEKEDSRVALVAKKDYSWRRIKVPQVS